MSKYIVQIWCLFLGFFLCGKSEGLDKKTTELACSILKTDAVSIQSLKGGCRAQVFKASHSCVIRYINKENPLEKREREIAIAQYASDMGFGPHILFSDAESGIIVMECLDTIRPSKSLFGALKWNEEIGRTIGLLHKGPKQSVRNRSMFNQTRQLLNDPNAAICDTFFPLDFLDSILKECKTVFASIGNDQYVCSHGDLHPGNLLYTAKGFRIIDYESVANDSLYVDLAAMAIQNRSNTKKDIALLKGYFNRMPTDSEFACLSIMKHVSYLYFGFVRLLNAIEDLIEKNIYEDTDALIYNLAMAYQYSDFEIENDDYIRSAFSWIDQALFYFESAYYKQHKNVILNQNKG